jgi:hypothetical protein
MRAINDLSRDELIGLLINSSVPGEKINIFEESASCVVCGEPYAKYYYMCDSCREMEEKEWPEQVQEQPEGLSRPEVPPPVPPDPRDETIRQLREAFLKGAKWWEFKSTCGTMWQSDQKEVWEAACRKYPDSAALERKE